jgi:ribosomal protein L16/L10AE
MENLLAVAETADFGDLLVAIYNHCKDMKAKQSFHNLAKPYSETLLALFPDKPLKQVVTYGTMRMSNGAERDAYKVTLTRADGKVTVWALFVDDSDMIVEVAEQEPDLPSRSMILH